MRSRAHPLRWGADVAMRQLRCGTRWPLAALRPPWPRGRASRGRCGTPALLAPAAPLLYGVAQGPQGLHPHGARLQRGRRGGWGPCSPGVGTGCWGTMALGDASSRRQHKGGVGTHGRGTGLGTGAHATWRPPPPQHPTRLQTTPGGDAARSTPAGWQQRRAQRGSQITGNWLQVFRHQKLLAAVIREANRGIRAQGS